MTPGLNRHLLAVPRFRLNTYGRRAFSVAGPMAWNSLSWILSEIQRAAQTVLGVYLKRTCSRVTSASSALGVLNDYALYKSTHSHTRSDELIVQGVCNEWLVGWRPERRLEQRSGCGRRRRRTCPTRAGRRRSDDVSDSDLPDGRSPTPPTSSSSSPPPASSSAAGKTTSLHVSAAWRSG